MNSRPLNILLADDDTDDCNFFEKALEEISIATKLQIVNDGEELMNYLSDNLVRTQNYTPLPDVIFLDLSMPRKTGFECLTEIKQNEKLKDIQVVMFSTSYLRDYDYEKQIINILKGLGADDYIRKRGGFEQLKQVINEALIKVKEKRGKKYEL